MQLKFWRHDLQLRNAWAIAGSVAKHVHPVMFVRLKDASGATGLGESAPSRQYHETVETVEKFLKLVDSNRLSFGDVAGSVEYLNALAPGNHSAKNAVNVALLDGAAKLAGLPLHQFLGLTFSPAGYTTSFSIGIAQPTKIGEKVRAAAEFPVLKLKVGSAHDHENLAALRTEAPIKPVRVDANGAWKTKEAALEHIEWLAKDDHIEFVEQPMPATTKPADLIWLKERSPLPLFADESYHFATDAERCVDGFHGVNVKLHKTGGLTAAVAALRAARLCGMETMLGCMIESSVLISAAAHLASLTDHFDLDGNLLVSNDPFCGVTTKGGVLTFKDAPEKAGLQVVER